MHNSNFQMRCDTCGCFMSPEPGASWVMVPACDIPGEYGDERTRCVKCTEIHGAAQCGSKYKQEMCQGVFGA